MSTTYEVIGGDSFEIIARKIYGDNAQAGRLRRANPGVLEPLLPGQIINVPNLPERPEGLASNISADTDDETAVLIDGERFRFWSEISLITALDTVDIVEFTAPFNPEDESHREKFRPFNYSDVVVYIGGNPVFAGTMIGVRPITRSRERIVKVSCYALPGVLNDCTVSPNDFPSEYNNQTLKDIAERIVEPFGIRVVFDDDPGPSFERVAIDPKQRVMDFLIDLSKQRGLLMTNTEKGELRFFKPPTGGAPVAQLNEGLSPLTTVTPSFDPQSYYSHITGIKLVMIGDSGSKHTVQNPRLTGTLRPLSFSVDDTDNGDLITAVEAKTGRMYANMVSYQVTVATWRNESSELWQPGDVVTLNAPGAMVYDNYNLMIRSVTFDSNNRSRAATLDLVFPEAFNNEIPEALPWD